MSDLLEYKCPACGGVLEFDSSLQKLKCPFCDSVFDVSEVNDDSGNEQMDTDRWTHASNSWQEGETDNLSVFVCNSCGGEIVGDENTGASECPFCGNQVVMAGRFSGKLKPDFVIPFKLDKNAAKAKYQEHISGKFLLPKAFKSENHIDEIKGVYVPFWLYDSDISADCEYDAEQVRHWSDKKYDYTERKIYKVYRSGDMRFENIPCDGSKKMDDSLMESIEPFDFSQAVPFQSAYLAGYFADKYDVDQFENQERANHRILNSAVDVLEDTFRNEYTSVSCAESSMRVTDGVIKYALYPVWLLTSTYQGEKYTFAMNGQTGKFVGNLPCDKKKSLITFLASFVGASVVGTGLITLLMNLFGG